MPSTRLRTAQEKEREVSGFLYHFGSGSPYHSSYTFVTPVPLASLYKSRTFVC